MFTVSPRFTIVSGDTLELEFDVTDQDGQDVPLIGITVQFAVSRSLDNEMVIAPEDVALSILDADNGRFRVKAAPVLTEDLNGQHRFQARLTDAAGDRQTVALGTLWLHRGVLVAAEAV